MPPMSWAVLLLLLFTRVDAQILSDQMLIDTGTVLLAQPEAVSQDQAAAIARQATGGRVLDVNTEEVQGQRVHKVKLLFQDGRVRIVQVDAQSGHIKQ